MTQENATLPMTIIAGFLGSGKTTMVNHLLKNAGGQRLLIMVNDFGDISIDSELIIDQDGNTLTLANGCACCSMGGDLFQAFEDALNYSPRPDQLIIEASGVAEPRQIANFGKAEPELSFNAIVTVVDAQNLLNNLQDKLISGVIEEQIHAAHLLVINKMDGISEKARSELKQLVLSLNDKAALHFTENADVPFELVFGPMDLAKGEPLEVEEHMHHRVHGDIFERCSISNIAPLSPNKAKAWAESVPANALRLKGIFQDADNPDVRWSLHRVGTHISLTRLKHKHSNQTATGFVAIGTKENFTTEAIQEKMNQLVS